METRIQEMMLWYDLHRLQEHYVSVIDTDHLEEWPDLFTEDPLLKEKPNHLVVVIGRRIVIGPTATVSLRNQFQAETA
jgi:hypothetical protein